MPSSGQKNSAMTGISIRVIDPLIPACGRLRPNYQLRRQRLPSQCAEDTAGKKRLKTKRPDCYLLIHRPFFLVCMRRIIVETRMSLAETGSCFTDLLYPLCSISI